MAESRLWDNTIQIGNTQLLEATLTCDEILPRRRRPHCKAAEELYVWLPGGEFC